MWFLLPLLLVLCGSVILLMLVCFMALRLMSSTRLAAAGIVSQDRDLSATIVKVLDDSTPSKQIRRVPPHFKHRKTDIDVYDPIIISLGPYHHGRSEYRYAELFKQVSLSAFVSYSFDDTKDESFYYSKILERIQDVRDCYEEVEYDDQALARMMLCDACFFIYTMELASTLATKDVAAYYRYFGIGAMNIIGRDLLLLENQIPLWVMELLICSRSSESLGQSVWNALLAQHIKRATSVNLRRLPWVEETYEPFHFLDAVRYFHIIPVKALDRLNISESIGDIYEEASYQFRSVTDLKVKGIRFRPDKSANGDNRSINFTSHSMYGQLTLPPLIFSVNFFVLYSNFIAYEIFPTSNAKLYATAFVNFLKSLMETSNDVKILREEGILFSNIGSDKEVFQMIKDLHTFGVDRTGVFLELKKNIRSHCNSKTKTWVAELIHTYFRSPWTTIAVFAAFALLCLTFLQTFFTIRPRN